MTGLVYVPGATDPATHRLPFGQRGHRRPLVAVRCSGGCQHQGPLHGAPHRCQGGTGRGKPHR